MKNCKQRYSSKLILGFILFGGCVASTYSQGLYISKYVGLGTPEDINHRIEIFNENPSYHRDLSGYFIITRNYIARLPKDTKVGPMKALRLGKLSTADDLDIEFLGGLRDFYIRIRKDKSKGDFVVLLDPQQKLIDAFYFAPQRRVSFLPTRDIFATYGDISTPVSVPDESSPVWGYLIEEPDPAMAFHRINKQWKITSRKRESNLLRATKYENFSTSYVDGIVRINWETPYEQDCYQHILERSQDGKNFTEIAFVPAGINSSLTRSYKYYDEDIEKDQFYFYRLRNTDKFGKVVTSELKRVRSNEGHGSLSIDLITQTLPEGKALNVRFDAKENQRVRVKILDEEFRQLDVLFYGEVTALKQYLIKYTKFLPIGKYFLIADTPQVREYITFIIDKNRKVIILRQ